MNKLNCVITDKPLNTYLSLLKSSIRRYGVVSEDSIRYLFYAAVLSDINNFKKNVLIRILQEAPYKNNKTKLINKNNLMFFKTNRNGSCLSKLDTFIDCKKPKYAIEFKFDRELNSEGRFKKVPKPKYFGQILNDLNRLSLINSKVERLLICLMDECMIKYLENHPEHLYRKIFFNSGSDFQEISNSLVKKGVAKTTYDEAYKSFKKVFVKRFKTYRVSNVYKKRFRVKGKTYCLFILKVNDYE